MKIDEEVQRLLEVLPPRVKLDLSKHAEINVLIEVILDLGRAAEARYADNVYYLPGEIVNQKDIEFVVEKLGSFSSDNRAGIECTLHRISCLRNRTGKIVGLTCRVGRVIYGTNDIIRDVIESGKNILFLGPPGIGKATRMQVQTPEFQHRVMIEAVENHMPEVVIVDEIGTEAEAAACRTIAERGVQLIGTAHGVYLENVISNPTLSDLAGGIQSVILGDEEAKRRHTQKAILERKAPPTFDVCIEIRERDKFAIYTDVAKAVDSILRERVPHPEIRVRKEGGKIEVHKAPEEMPDIDDIEVSAAKKEVDKEIVRIFPFGVNRGILERALLAMQVPATVSRKFDEADIVLTTKAKARAGTKIEKAAREHGLPLHVIKNNVAGQVNRFLKYYFKVEGREESDAIAIREAEEAIEHVKTSRKVLDLNPQNAYLRRLQHQLVQEAGLNSVSVGDEPKRRLRIYPV